MRREDARPGLRVKTFDPFDPGAGEIVAVIETVPAPDAVTDLCRVRFPDGRVRARHVSGLVAVDS